MLLSGIVYLLSAKTPITILLVLYLLIRFKGFLRILWFALTLPGPPAYPLIGNSYLTLDDKRMLYLASNAKYIYGSIIRVWASVFPLIFILEPKDIQKVLLSSKHVEKIYIYRWMDYYLGSGLVTSKGEQWRRHRRLIQPKFSRGSLSQFTDILFCGAKKLVDSIENQIQSAGGDPTLNIIPFVNNCVFNILSETVFGPGVKLGRDDINLTPRKRGSSNIHQRFHNPLLILDFFYNYSLMGQYEKQHQKRRNALIKELVEERVNKRTEGLKCPSNILDDLIGLDLTQEECVQEVLTFLLAGQDTVSVALASLLYLIAKHPKVQEKAADEVRRMVPKDSFSFEVLKDLRYVEQCVKEAIRLFPPVPVFARKVSDDVQLDDYVIPAGSEVVISPYVTHRLTQLFSDPEEFDPDRFTPESIRSRPQCAYIPFCAGPRNCIAKDFALMELKILLGTILQKFKLELVPGKEDITVKFLLTIRITGGVWIRFVERDPVRQK